MKLTRKIRRLRTEALRLLLGGSYASGHHDYCDTHIAPTRGPCNCGRAKLDELIEAVYEEGRYHG